ncbi:MAG: hypothetical protein J7K53_11350 [Bacteroidales bacterium]|nr:hypothetical protein [Bacteroidales bacterium]
MTTNTITLPKDKAYLISFISVVLKKEGKSNIILANNFHALIKSLVRKPPADFLPQKNKKIQNEFQVELPNWSDVDINYNFYLSKSSQNIIVSWLYMEFWRIFDIHMSELYNKVEFKHAVYFFIEIYNLPDTKYWMLERRDRRKRKNLIPKKTKIISSVFSSHLSVVCPLVSLIVLFCPF